MVPPVRPEAEDALDVVLDPIAGIALEASLTVLLPPRTLAGPYAAAAATLLSAVLLLL